MRTCGNLQGNAMAKLALLTQEAYEERHSITPWSERQAICQPSIIMCTPTNPRQTGDRAKTAPNPSMQPTPGILHILWNMFQLEALRLQLPLF